MPKKDPTKSQLVHQINQLGREMSTKTVVFHQAIAEKAGLAGTDHKYIDLLLKNGSMTAGALAKFTGLTTGAVTGVIDRLEKQKLVKRERNPNDRRQVLVVLQEREANRRIGPAFEHMQADLDDLYRDYSIEEMQIIKSYLEKIVAFYDAQINYLNEK